MQHERGAEGAGRRKYESAEPLVCVECGTLSDNDAWGWRAYRMDDPERHWLPALALYCPICAEREFGGP
jgi:hypothetical protein